MSQTLHGSVLAVSLSRGHHFSKTNAMMIRLLQGLGVEGDCHAGVTVKHRSRVRVDPTQANLRQVHLIDESLLVMLRAKGFAVGAGDLGENITTRGIDLINLSRGARLRLGEVAEVEITGLRNPCGQLNGFAPGLMEATLERGEDGSLIRLAGVMGVVTQTGDVRPKDDISIAHPAGPRIPLERV